MGTNGFPGIHIAKRKRVIQFVTFLSFDRWVGHLSNLWSSGSRELSIPFKGHVSAEIARNFLCFPGRVTHFPRRFPFWIPKTLKSDLPIRKGIIFQLPKHHFSSSTPGVYISHSLVTHRRWAVWVEPLSTWRRMASLWARRTSQNGIRCGWTLGGGMWLVTFRRPGRSVTPNWWFT